MSALKVAYTELYTTVKYQEFTTGYVLYFVLCDKMLYDVEHGGSHIRTLV